MELETLEWLVWLIPLLPFAGFLINGFIGRSLPKAAVGFIACILPIGSFVVSCFAFAYVWHHKHHDPAFTALVSDSIPWIQVQGLKDGSFLRFLAEHKLVIDNYSCVMLMVVAGVGSVIHVYSIGYMEGDKRYARYFAYLNLFMGFMLLLVTASNLFLMFVGWEGVGLCSYLLIGFWYEDREKAQAGMKAFIVNRIGDFAFTVGVLLLFVYVGTGGFGAWPAEVWTVDFTELRQILAENAGAVDAAVLTAVGILLFGGATGKSAQIPLYVWLPDAMAGPTPVSALIHAATMVTAGVYMVARMGFLYTLAPYALLVVAVVGGFTAFFAGTIAVAQNDIKKVLAYSTVSQLGFMFMGVGSGFFYAGIFHLMTHAFFKACLFLGSGSVIHGMGGEQDIRRMGGLFPKMKITAVTFIIASLALAGLPFLTAGFVSKEAALGALWASAGHGPLERTVPWLAQAISMLGFAAAGLTAFYMTRLVIKTFFGEARWKKAEAHGHDDSRGHGHGEPHESPFSMWFPLVILAFFSVFGAFVFLGKPFLWDVAHWMGGEQPREVHHHVPSAVFYMLSFAMSLGGIGLGFFIFWIRKDIPEKAAESFKPLHQALLNKWYVDELYFAAVINPLLAVNKGIGTIDNYVIDGAVNEAANTTASSSQGSGYFDNEVVDGAVNGAGRLVCWKASVIRRLQTGNIKAYLTTTVVGGLFLIAVYCVYLSRQVLSDILGRIFG